MTGLQVLAPENARMASFIASARALVAGMVVCRVWVHQYNGHHAHPCQSAALNAQATHAHSRAVRIQDCTNFSSPNFRSVSSSSALACLLLQWTEVLSLRVRRNILSLSPRQWARFLFKWKQRLRIRSLRFTAAVNPTSLVLINVRRRCACMSRAAPQQIRCGSR